MLSYTVNTLSHNVQLRIPTMQTIQYPSSGGLRLRTVEGMDSRIRLSKALRTVRTLRAVQVPHNGKVAQLKLPVV